MGCCKSEPDVFKIEFTNLMNEGCRMRPNAIDELYQKVVAADVVDDVLDAVDEKKRTAFHLAAENGHVYMLEWCIKTWKHHGKTMPMDAQNYNGFTALGSACYRGQRNMRSTTGSAQLTVAMIKDIKDDRLAIVKLLVENGADLNYVIEPIKMTALHWAAFNGDIATCRYLAEKGANVTFSA